MNTDIIVKRIEDSLKDCNDTTSAVHILKNIIDELNEEEFNELRQIYGNFYKAFIAGPEVDPVGSAIKNQFIISNHKPKINFTGVIDDDMSISRKRVGN